MTISKASTETLATLTVEKIVFGGLGLGHIDGKVCFVPFVLPDEIITVRLVDEKKDYAVGECVEITKPSPLRISAPCPYYARCGGCHYQHAPYAEQLRTKGEQVRDVFRRVFGPFDFDVHPVSPSHGEYFYRSDIKLSRNSRRIDFRYGLIGVDQKTVIPIDQCLIASEAINKELKSLGEHKEIHTDKLTIKAQDEGPASYWPGESEELTATVNKKIFRYDARMFFQVNKPVLEDILVRVAGEVSRKKPEGCFFDLYAGVGVFSIQMEPYFEKLVAVEENRKAVKYLEKNIRDNGLDSRKFVFHKNRVEEIFRSVFEKESMERNVLMLDPPRMGVHEDLIEMIKDHREKIDQILYLSCHPATLARDLKRLNESGFWSVKGVWPFDMFAQTKHIECLAVLGK